jgi:hypothetical protein
MARSPYVSGRPVTPGEQKRSIHTDCGTGIRNPPRRSHKSKMISIVATHSWRPRWVRVARRDVLPPTVGLSPAAEVCVPLYVMAWHGQRSDTSRRPPPVDAQHLRSPFDV